VVIHVFASHDVYDFTKDEPGFACLLHFVTQRIADVPQRIG